MGNLFFWNHWPRPERFLFAATAIIFFAGAIWMWSSWWETPEPVFKYHSIQEAQLEEIPVDRFQKGVFEFAIPGNSYAVTERFLGAPMSVNLTASYIYLVFFGLFTSVMLALVTTVNRFYYLVCMGLFIILVATLELESLVLFGFTDRTPAIILLMVYLPVSMGMVYYAPQLRFSVRVLIFLGITLAFALVVHFKAGVPMPFVQLAANALPAGLAAAAIFIVTVSHEIPASFINVLTRGTRQRKTLNHFFIITIIYLINLGLAYAERFGFIRWNAVTIDLFLLLSISALLGIWGIRQRHKLFEGIIDVEPYGVLAFLLMGGLAFSAIGFMLATANDSGVSATRDIIIFSHIGYAIVFVIYVISNFIGMLAENLAVYRVLYTPNNMPFFTFRFAGLIASLAFLFYNTWQVPVNNVRGALQNANGDYFLSIGNTELARHYYTQGRSYAYNNHHSSYALANVLGTIMDAWKEREMYKAAVSVRPTPMAYLNLAQTYQSENKWFEAMLSLQEGLTEFPGNPELQNTLGLLHAKIGAIDSAHYYLGQVLRSPRADVARTNLNALETLALQAGDSTRISRSALTSLELPGDTALTLTQAAHISNSLVQIGYGVDTATISKVVSLARRPVNSRFSEAMLFAAALSWHANGEIGKAFRLLEEVTLSSNYKGKYNNILTIWAIEHNEPQRALGYLDYAIQQKYPTVGITHAVARTEAAAALSFFPFNKLDTAIAAWDSLIVDTDSAAMSAFASRMKKVLTIPQSKVNDLSDEDKYAFTMYRTSIADSVAFRQIVNTITDEEWRAKALLHRSVMLYRADETSSAVRVFQQLRGLQTTKATYDRIGIHEMILLSRTGNSTAIEEKLRGDIDFGGRNRNHRIYFEAVLANIAGDTTTATSLFNLLGTADPFFEDGVISAANYFVNHGTDKMKPYNILVNALQHHPSSIRIRKAYCLEAKRMGFTTFADDELETLRKQLPSARMTQFMQIYQSIVMED